jgi:CDP-glucose 4,6-dehydratase
MENSTFDFLKNKKVLITGHTGFKGSWLSLWLEMIGAKVYGISDLIPTVPSLFESLQLDKKMQHILLDIRDKNSIQTEILRIQPDFIFHLAAQPIVSTSYQDPIGTLNTNIMGTAHVLDAMRKLQDKCVGVFITSDKCYENVEWEWGYKETDSLGGKDIYSGSKAGAEIVFHSYFHSFLSKMENIKVATGRAGNVIGGGDWAKDRIVPDCIRAWIKKEKVEIRNPKATRPWQHVLEPLSGYLSLAQSLNNSEEHNGESFNFGPPAENNISVLELLQELSLRFGFESSEDAYYYNKDAFFPEAGLLKLNCDKALFRLKWKPNLNLKELIDFTGNWYWNNQSRDVDMLSFTSNQINDFVKLAKDRKIKWSNLSETTVGKL